jgi:hypothetical protein
MATSRRKTLQNGRNKHQGFTKLDHVIQDSIAFRDLSPHAVRILLEIMRRYNGKNNGTIPLSCREAATVAQCGKSSAVRFFRELQEHGFITKEKQGYFTVRDAAEWRLTFQPDHRQGRNPAPSHDWREWKPEKTKEST